VSATLAIMATYVSRPRPSSFVREATTAGGAETAIGTDPGQDGVRSRCRCRPRKRHASNRERQEQDRPSDSGSPVPGADIDQDSLLPCSRP
jgi:hypothetical protein